MNARHPLIGKQVVVTWRRSSSDWFWYRVLDVTPDWLQLQGMNSPSGDPYAGGPIWVPTADVECMEERQA